MTDDAIDEAVEVVEKRQVSSRDFTPVFLTDGTNLAPFRSRGYVVEYIPASITSPTSENRTLIQYLRARLELIKDKWGLCKLVHLGEKSSGWDSLSTTTTKSTGPRDLVGPEVVNTGIASGTKLKLDSLNIDVIICVHNALDDVRRCLSTVRSTIEDHHTLIVVDDGSDQDTARFLRCLSDDDHRVRLIRRNTAGGYTNAANCGVENSTADFVILLNSDTQVPAGWWRKLAVAVHQSPSTGIVGPISNAATWQSVPEINVGGDRRAANAMPQGFTVDDMDRIAEACSPAFFPSVGLANGFCLGVRRAVFDAIGLFDNEAFPRGYGEENDFCIRAVDAGFEIVIATNCYVYHEESSSYFPSTRDRLARETEEILLKMYPAARIRSAVGSSKHNAALEEVRECFRGRMTGIS
jgi:GT2 family glycosyltransferase